MKHITHTGRMIGILAMLCILLVSGCGGSGSNGSGANGEAEEAAAPTATPDPLAGIVGKDWKATLASAEVAGIGGSVDLTMTFYENGDVRAEIPMLANYTGRYTLADSDTIRIDWREEVLWEEEPGETTEFWTFSLNGDELVMTRDGSDERRVYTAQ